jgi:hypothetical protein
MKKPSTTALRRIRRLQDGQLTIGLDLGDRSSFYCVLNSAGVTATGLLMEGQSTHPPVASRSAKHDRGQVPAHQGRSAASKPELR